MLEKFNMIVKGGEYAIISRLKIYFYKNSFPLNLGQNIIRTI